MSEPASPDTYGEHPHGYRLPDATHLGGVRLQVANLARSRAFYEGTLGMRVLEDDGRILTLTAHDDDAALVQLEEQSGVRPVPPQGRLGLFHFAILLPDEASLGRFVQHLATIGARAGSADHLVSQSIYLHDPDNLGIEVYADRPKSTWRRLGRELMMATDPLNIPALVNAAGRAPWTGMPRGTTMGHVHLRVGDLDEASEFFSEALGFDRMVWSYPGALFLAAGGYHHHLGTNTWAGPSTTSARPDEARLLEWTIRLPSAADVTAASESLKRAGHAVDWDPVEPAPAAFVTQDPWGTRVRLQTTAGASHRVGRMH